MTVQQLIRQLEAYGKDAKDAPVVICKMNQTKTKDAHVTARDIITGRIFIYYE